MKPGMNRMASADSGTAKDRRGTVTVVALVVLVVLAGMLGQHVRRVLMDRRQFRQEAMHLQAEKLASAGLDLAVAARLEDPEWSGMNWNLPVGTIHQTNSAEVVIGIQDDVCTVVARYPANLDIPFKVTRIRKLVP